MSANEKPDMGHNQSESVGQHPNLNDNPPQVGPGAGVDIDSSAMPEDGIIDIQGEDDPDSMPPAFPRTAAPIPQSPSVTSLPQDEDG